MRKITGWVLVSAVLVLWLLPVAPSVAAGADTYDQFIIDCMHTNERGKIDPITAPGGTAAHSHDFFGRGDITKNTTPAQLAAGPDGVTNCSSPSDTSGYWAPTLYYKALGSSSFVATNAVDFHTYWRRGAFPCTPPGCASDPVQALPAGVGYVAGNSASTSPQDMNVTFWDCGANPQVTSIHSTNPHSCAGQGYTPSGGLDGLTAVIRFPQCWNGTLATPPGLPYNMTQDFAYPSGGQCPPGFSIKIERLEEHIHYGIWDPCNGATPCNPSDPATIANLKVKLSSGSTTPYNGTSDYSMHADTMNGWHTQQDLIDITNHCLNPIDTSYPPCAGVHV